MSSGAGARLSGVVHLYRQPDADVVALAGVDLDIPAGDMLALLGPSGSGKSILALLAGLLRPTTGTVSVAGQDLTRLKARQLARMRATEIALVLQDPSSNLLAYGTVAQNVAFAQTGARTRGRPALTGARDLLHALGLAAVADRSVSALSGGDQQRVAAGMAAGPRLLLVDEPTSQLDHTGRQQVIELLHTINVTLGTTVVAVTHDPAVAASMPRTITIRAGRIGSQGQGGRDYAVVGTDGSIQLPPEALVRFPPGSLVEIQPHPEGFDLRPGHPR